MNYVRQQFEKLDGSAQYKVKMRGSEGETHWMSVPPVVAREIADVLADNEIRTEAPASVRPKVCTPYRTFTAEHGVTFAVRYLPLGARYGTGNSVVTNGPMVEFYDTRFADDRDPGKGFGPLGQFVSRYYVSTLLGTNGYGSGAGGLDLEGGVPAWTVDAGTMRLVRSWLATQVDSENSSTG